MPTRCHDRGDTRACQPHDTKDSGSSEFKEYVEQGIVLATLDVTAPFKLPLMKWFRVEWNGMEEILTNHPIKIPRTALRLYDPSVLEDTQALSASISLHSVFTTIEQKSNLQCIG